MRRLGLGFVAGAAFVVATGLWAPAGAVIVDFGIDSPADGEVTSNKVVPVQVHAESDSNAGLQYLRLELEGPGFSNRVVWCAPGPTPQCPAFSSTTRTYDGTFNWDTTSLTSYNGDYTLKLVVKDNDGQIKTDAKQVRVNTPPAIPSWTSVTPSTNGGPKMTLKWKANSEPDIVSYRITRTSSNGGPNTFFKVEKDNPGGQGCSLSGGTYTCTDTAFPASGYGGTYTYYLAATRNSPVTSSGVSSGQSPRAASMSEPKPTPTTGGGGGGGGRGGTGGSGGGGSTQSPGNGFITRGGTPGASLTPTPDPFAPDPGEFYTGTYEKQLPDKPRTSIVLGTQERQTVAGFASEDDLPPLDVRKTLLPIAGGLFTLTAALHFRRIIRDH